VNFCFVNLVIFAEKPVAALANAFREAIKLTQSCY